jgi:hypothetical protein
MAFGREERAGTRIIRMIHSPQDEIRRTVSTVSTVGPTDGSTQFGPKGRVPAKAISQGADGAAGTVDESVCRWDHLICSSLG